MPCYSYRGKRPRVAPDAWIAPTAILIGDVTVHAGASIWWGTVLRGDMARIEIGERSNVQDNSTIHTDPDGPTIIGSDVTVGHMALVHTAIVESHVLVGQAAVLVGENTVGTGSIIAAGAVVPQGFAVPARSLVAGVPAKVLRPVKAADERWTHHAAEHYVELSREYLSGVREVAPEPL